jgi:hypothetical protein
MVIWKLSVSTQAETGGGSGHRVIAQHFLAGDDGCCLRLLSRIWMACRSARSRTPGTAGWSWPWPWPAGGGGLSPVQGASSRRLHSRYRRRLRDLVAAAGQWPSTWRGAGSSAAMPRVSCGPLPSRCQHLKLRKEIDSRTLRQSHALVTAVTRRRIWCWPVTPRSGMFSAAAGLRGRGGLRPAGYSARPGAGQRSRSARPATGAGC